MTRSEQQKMIRDLRYYLGSMSSEDRRAFEMLEKRDRDDEDFDTLSAQTLERLHMRYMPRKSKQDVEELWKKLTSKGKSDNPD